MDNVIGPLVIALLAIISVVGQILESRKKNEIEKQRRMGQGDVPESTRRMLYGEGGEADIPMAKPRQGAPPIPPPPPPPIQQRRESTEPQTAKPHPTPARKQVAAERRTMQSEKAQRTASYRRPDAAQQGPRGPHPPAAPARQKQTREWISPEARRRVQQTLEEVWRQVQQAAQGETEMEAPRRTPPQAPRPKQAQKLRPKPRPPVQQVPRRESEGDEFVHRVPRRTPTPATIARAQLRPLHPLMRGLLSTHANVRRGILLREILGPPKGLQ